MITPHRPAKLAIGRGLQSASRLRAVHDWLPSHRGLSLMFPAPRDSRTRSPPLRHRVPVSFGTLAASLSECRSLNGTEHSGRFAESSDAFAREAHVLHANTAETHSV